MDPVIDRRDLVQIISRMREMVPAYTPEWHFNPDDPDAGTVLFLLFADMLQSNIKRLNRVPQKQFTAFLNMLGISLQPALPAAGYAVFELAAGTLTTVPLPAGTPVSGLAADGAELAFETTEPVRLTPASVVDLYHASRIPDRIVSMGGPFRGAQTGERPTPVRLFDMNIGTNLQEHALYLAHEEVLAIRSAALIEVQLDHSQERFRLRGMAAALSDPVTFTWSYWSGGKWVSFDQVSAAEGGVRLHKRSGLPIEETVVGGRCSRWIRCILNGDRELQHLASSIPFGMLPEPIVLDGIRIRSSHEPQSGAPGFPPDRLYWNDVEIDAEQGGFVFGRTPPPYSVFYIASREAFTKKGAVVRLSFRQVPVRTEPPSMPAPPIQWKLVMKSSDFPPPPPEPQELYVERVLWEYWNGSGWSRLFKDSEGESIFRTREETYTTLEFVCPSDLEETLVNAQANYWIRARVLSSDHQYPVLPTYVSPLVDRLGLTYEYREGAVPVQGCLSMNNAEVLDHLPQAGEPWSTFQPFVPLGVPGPCVYFGFDTAPVQGPLRMLLTFQPQLDTEESLPPIEWEYSSSSIRGGEWKKLNAVDETEGFRRTGTLQFTGPSDHTAVSCFGRTRYWIRAVLRYDRRVDGQEFGSTPVLLGLYMNAVRIHQQESREHEIPERLSRDVQDWVEKSGPKYRLGSLPVLQENVWVDETGTVPEEELSRLKSGDPASVQIQQDSSGRLHRVWIRWERVPDLRDSAEGERHYMLDPHTGVLTFGNGVHGRRLPHEGPEILKVSYKTGGGAKGNVDAYRINKLKRSIAFVSGVFNPEPAGGGGDSETVEEAMLRGPQLLKHRQRAVSPGDFEWLAREACPEIVRVKCLPNTDAGMQPAPGQVTLIVLTRGALQDAGRFPEYRRRIESYLMQRAPAPLAAAGRIRAVPPVFLAVSVTAELTVRDPADLLHTEEQAALELERFLDPVHGSPDGAGWGFGEPIHPSVFYGVLRSVPGVASVSALRITVSRWVNRQLQEVDLETASSLLNGIRCSGTHRLRITL
ncbi:hypothetical protein J2T17_002620 [Paenibacillus mucilaginosus]|uniref:putative baseplate assembly protein n=1 Tax=Paenibacillus mucilaginosus TaxID=61624 RepID=UPI003D238241